MRVTVKLFATLKEYAPVQGLSGTPFDMDVPETTTLGDIIEILKLPVAEVKIPFVNGIVKSFDWKLNPGDDLGIFPPVGGG
ncbi:MAG: MoaD/ThiS family protein [Leptolinea sp.]